MEYEIKEIQLRNKDTYRKRLIIEFADKSLNILAEFLMVDAPLLNWRIIKDVEGVLSNKKERIQLAGNRTKITVTKKETIIEDLYEDLSDYENKLQQVTLHTAEFQSILQHWHEETTALNRP